MRCVKNVGKIAAKSLQTPVYIGRHPGRVPGPALIFFPCTPNTAACGLAGIVAVKRATLRGETVSDLEHLSNLLDRAEAANRPVEDGQSTLDDGYLGGGIR
jgi:hypothetical protein